MKNTYVCSLLLALSFGGISCSSPVDAATAIPGPAGPQGIQGPAGPAGPQGIQGVAGADGKSFVSPMQGKGLGIEGDSFSSDYGYLWQKVVMARTGMTLVYQTAHPSRTTTQAFECFGNPAVGQAPGGFDPTHTFSYASGTCAQASTAKAGSTLAENLAGVDVLVVELSTNDVIFNTPVGNVGDPITAGTFSGNLRWMVATDLAAKPTLHIVFVTAQTIRGVSAALLQQYVSAMVAVGASLGLPVINEAALGGVNEYSAATLLRPDGVHPSDLAFTNFYGPVLAQGILAVN